jgi:Fe2+ or Zn2+ uptake regulation protein
VYVRLSGTGEPPSLPEITSRAGVYRWLAALEEQGLVTGFTENP